MGMVVASLGRIQKSLGSASVLMLILMTNSAFGQTTVSSIAAMKALNATDPRNATVTVTGYYSANDGGGGTFNWNSTSTVATNYGTIFKGQKTGAELATGRWVRQIAAGTPYSVKWFGAVGNGSADDTPRIASAMKTLPTNGVMTLPSGTYQISKLSVVRGDFTLRGPGRLRCSTTNDSFFSIAGSNVTLDGITIDGNFRATTGLVAEDHSLNWNLTNVTVANCYLNNVLAPTGGGVAQGILARNGCQNFTLTSCTISNINHAYALDRVSRGFRGSVYKPTGTSDYLKNFTFNRCLFDAISPLVEGDCIVFQGQTNTVDVGILITNCTFRNYGHRAGKIMVSGGKIVNCVADRALTDTAAAYSAFSFYGWNWQCLSNRVTGTNPYGIEAGFTTWPVQNILIADNIIQFTTNGLKTAVGVWVHESCRGVLALRNSVANALWHTQIGGGDVRDSAFVGSIGTNIMTTGVLVSQTAGVAPSNISILQTSITAPAKYGVRVDAGTNITAFGFAGSPTWGSMFFASNVVQSTPKIAQSVKRADYALQLTDLTATASAPLRFTLPDSITAKPGKCFILRTANGVTATTVAAGTNKIAGATTDTIAPGAAKVYVNDGRGNWNIVNVTTGPT